MAIDEEDLDAARALAASRAWTPERVLTDIETVDLIDADLVESLRQTRDALIPGLHAIMRTRAGRAKLQASLLLLHLGDLSGTLGLAELLADDDDDALLQRLASISILPAYRLEGEHPLSRRVPVDGDVLWPPLARLLRSEDERVAYLAASVATRTYGMPATMHATMHALLRDPRPRVRNLALGWHAGRGEDGGALDVLEAALLGNGPTARDDYACLGVLDDYSKSKDESIRARAGKLAARYIEARLPEDTGNSADNDLRNAITALEGFAEERAVLETIVASPRTSWVRGIALRRQALLDGPAALRWLQQRATTEDDDVMVKYVAEAVEAVLRAHPDAQGRDSMRAALGAAAARTANEETSRALLAALVPLGGDLGPALEALEARAEGWDRTWTVWLRRGLDVPTVCAELEREEVVEAPAPGDLVRLTSMLSEGPAVVLFDLFFAAHRLHMFDTEASVVPPDYIDLLGAVSRIVPELGLESPSQDATASGITVRFVAENRLFRFSPEDRGDWFDVGAVLATVNHALEVAGHRHRCFSLHTGDQTCIVVCAPGDGFRRAAERLAIPIEEDADAAMRAGIAFEEVVRAQFGKE